MANIVVLYIITKILLLPKIDLPESKRGQQY